MLLESMNGRSPQGWLTAASFEFGLFFNANVDDHPPKSPTNPWLGKPLPYQLPNSP